MIVNHLKSQGLFDQFRRDCLADVDTKPAYQNLRQRVDNFVANHLATHTWSPHLNKNQLRNNIRQQVLKSGMLESGIDRIISQVVDPKINHTFRPQVEKAVHEFLATLNHREEAGSSAAPEEEKAETVAGPQGVPAPGPSANVASDAMSILETITSLNQEASAARASTETTKGSERVVKKALPQPGTETGAERERASEDAAERDRPAPDSAGEGQEAAPKPEELTELPGPAEEAKPAPRESTVAAPPSRDVPQESSDQKTKPADKGEKRQDGGEKDRKKEKKEKTEKKSEHARRSDELQKGKDEKQAKEKEGECSKLPSEKNSTKPRAVEGAKEDSSLMDSDVDGLTDITVSSVHTSDLSSFEEDTEEEVVLSDSMEEGEITSDDEQKSRRGKAKPQGGDPAEGRARSVRQAYVHKPYLYSKYYSDSDDELTVEQRRQSIAKEKEERLLRRQINREKLEEKRKQKAEKTKSSKAKSQGKSNVDPEEPPKSLEPKAPGIKEVLKERKVLEKKVALSKKRKKDSRNVEENSKKKQQSEEDSKETLKAIEHCEKEKASSSKDSKHVYAKSEPSKPARRLSECLHSADENRNEREHKRRTSTPVLVEAAPEETDSKEGKRPVESSDASSEESQKQRGSLKSEKHPKKEDSETPPLKTLPRKEAKSSSKDKPEKEKTLADDKASVKHKYKGDESEPHSSEKSLRVEESVQKQSQLARLPSDEKAERKSKHRNERKLSVLGKDGKPVSEYIIKTDENVRKENKKERHAPTEKTKAEHKSRRLSDSKLQKDSLSSRQHGVPLQRRSESYSEDRCETDGASLDSNAKPEEAEAKKEKRRTKSLAEEKATLRSKSKGQGKLPKGAETELQESASRQPATARTEKEKGAEESDLDRQRKSKVEDKPEEAGTEPAAESSAALPHGTQKESGHRAKGPLAKEKYKGEKDSSACRTERKSSDGHKSRSLKHSSKDVRKKEENRSDERDVKEADGNHERARGNSSGTEKKLSRRLSENRRGSLSQEVTRGEEKPSVNTPGASSLQRPKKSGGEATLIPEQEPMETDSELASENVCEASKPQDGGSGASQPDTDSENAAKQKVAATLSKEELKTAAVDANTGAPASKAKHGTGLAASSEKHADHKSSQTKKGHAQSVVPRQHPGEREAAQAGAEEVGADPQAGLRVFPRAPTGNGRTQKSVRNAARPTEERVASREAAPEHPTGVEGLSLVGSVAPAPQTRPLDAEVIPSTDRRPGREGGKASASRLHHCETPGPSWPGGESEVPGLQHSKEGAASTGETPAKAGAGSRGHAPERRQAASVPGKQGKVGTALGGELTGSALGNENAGREGGSVGKAERKRDWNSEPASEQAVQAAVENGRGDRVAVDHVVDTGDGGAVGHRGSREPREAGSSSAEARGQNGSSEVGTSAATDTATPGPHQANGEAGSVPDGCVGAEKTPVATSTEGETEDAAFKPAKAGDASTTSPEAGAGEVAAPCTSIEADEGMVAGACPVFAAAEEGGAVVTEGRAGSETVLTSTREGDSGACSTAGSAGRAQAPATARPVAVEDQGVEAEEKDDAVTSAGSEDKCNASSGRDSERAAGTAAFNSEGESDGAVTSAGTEIRTGSASSDEGDESQRGAIRMEAKKETEGTVTCTVARHGGETLMVCAMAGARPPEELMVTGAAEGPVDDNEPLAPGATPERGGPTHDGAEGESAVTSTGITEDSEGPASCTGLGGRREGFPHGDNAMDSTATQEVSAIPGVAAGQCDDEGVVTSTGAKEEDEEDEGVVTSTGRGNDIGHGPTCTGAEEESEGAVVCESAGGPGQLVATVGLVEAGATRDSRVDSVSGTEKEAKDPEVGSSAKGVVGSSVTSAVKGDVAGDAVGAEGPMTSTAPGKRDGQPTRVGALGDAAVSTGLVGGSCEVLVSGAAPTCDTGDTSSPGEKEDEGAITSADNEDSGGPSATLAHDSAAGQVHTAGGRAPGKGLAISTSAAQLGQTPRVEKGTCAARSEQREGPGGSLEEFEAPMPSAVSGAENQTLRSEEKDECAMISTSIGEDSDAPISSATATTCAERQPPGATMGDRADGLALVSTQDFEAPMPSAPAGPGSPLASAGQEEKDEYALISTSIAEGCEAAVSGGDLEEKDGSAVISTSSGEDADGPVSSAVPREPSATPTEDVSEAPVISTSTSEGCEAATREAARQDVPLVQRGEDAADVAVISTSTAECVARGHEEGGQDPPAAGNSGQLPVTAEVGSAGAGETQEGQRRRSAGGGPPNAEEKHSGEPQSEGRALPSTLEKTPVGTVQREPGSSEPGALRDSYVAALVVSGSSTGPRGTEQPPPVGGEHRSSVDAGAPRAGDTAPVSAAAAERLPRPPAQQGAGDSGKTSVGQEAAIGGGPPKWSAARQEELAVKSEPRGAVTRPVPEEADLRVAVCPKEAVTDAGNEEAPLTVLGGSEQKAAARPEPCAPSEAERNDRSPAAGAALARGAAELQSNNPLADASLRVGNPGSPAAEEVQDKPCDRGAETSGAGRGDPHASREPSAGSDSKADEEEQLTPKRKRRRLCPSWEDELDDARDSPDARGETQRPCSETEPRDSREESSGDLDESCQASSKASSTASGPLEEKDEYSSGEAASEKAEANDEDGTKAQEEGQPIVIKRKRGRPRKYPVDAPSRLKEDSRVDPGAGAVEPSPPGSKPRATQTDEPSREAASLQDRSGSNDEEETAVASARRRGRKPKRPPALSDDAESSEPERKRQKSVSETTEDKKDQESEEDEEEEGEDEEEEQPTGATTRSTTRSEAQRKLHSQPPARAAKPGTGSPRSRQNLAKEKLCSSEKVSSSPPVGRSKAQLSPSAKRRREGSPPGARTRGQQRVEEAPAKKAKR